MSCKGRFDCTALYLMLSFWGEVGIPSNKFDNTYLEADKQINIQDFRPLQTSK